MAEENKELSIDFYNKICTIIGTEKVVKKRREIFTSLDCVVTDSTGLFISSGSKAEGLDLKGSDVDVMMCSKGIRVYKDDSKVFPSKRFMINLIMDTDDTKPGFTLLRSVTTNYPQYIKELFHEKYLSSKCFREFSKFLWDSTSYNGSDLIIVGSNDSDFILHGPCISYSDESVDYAHCFRCREWILPARQWISRPRKIWPETTTIRKIVDYGVLFVPIGCKGSPNEDLEWRISFSVAEKELIYTFNHVQLLCYALLKIALKDVIQKRYSDLLCSYFLKTILFWMCEESDQSTWKPDNFIKCFMNCFRRLIYCVEYKICLHYFIPENNFFENRFTASQHYDLLSFLQTLNNSGWSWILHTDTIQSYKRYINVLSYTPVVSSFQTLFILNDIIDVTEEIQNNMMRKSIVCSSICGNDIFIYHLSAVSQHLAQTILPHEECNKGNKQRYNQYRRCRCYLMIGLNHDAVSGWLLLASLFYTYKQYKECLNVIKYCLSKCKKKKTKIVSALKPDVIDQRRFERFMHILGRGKFLYSCKQCLIDTSCFSESSHILPAEIRCVVGMTEKTKIPSVVFAHFLRFVCFCRLGNQREKVEAFRDLPKILKRDFISQDQDLIDNANLCLQIAQEMMIQNS